MVINPNRVSRFMSEASYAIQYKATYQEVEAETEVPWPMIAVIHRRESNANFLTYLGNGQSLGQKTTITPIGRGPFYPPNAFVDGAIDAITMEGWGSVIDWRIEKQLYYCLLFNGIGSEAWGVPSSYIWGGTNVQKPGKWIRDHVWDPNFIDPQPGCAPLLWSIAKMDQTVVFSRETEPVVA